MPAPGTVWASGTWVSTAWATDTWADSQEAAPPPEARGRRLGRRRYGGLWALLTLLGGRILG